MVVSLVDRSLLYSTLALGINSFLLQKTDEAYLFIIELNSIDKGLKQCQANDSSKALGTIFGASV